MSEGLYYLAIRPRGESFYSFAEVVNLVEDQEMPIGRRLPIDNPHLSPTRYGLEESTALLFASSLAEKNHDVIVIERKHKDHAVTVPVETNPGDFYVVCKHPEDVYFSFTQPRLVGEGLGPGILPRSLSSSTSSLTSQPRFGLLLYSCDQSDATEISTYLIDSYRDAAVIKRTHKLDRIGIINVKEGINTSQLEHHLEEELSQSLDHNRRFTWPR